MDPALLLGLLRHPAGLPVGLGQVTVRRLCVDEQGQVVAVDVHPQSLGRLQSTGAAALVEALTERLPAPPPPTQAHDPTAGQLRVLHARDAECTFPGCRRPSRRSEADHRLRYPQGPTALCNLHPLCRYHHRLKHNGFDGERRPDGTTIWTTPRRQHVLVRPK